MQYKFILAGLLGVTAAFANAQVQITQHPGNFQGDQNILFNQNGLADNGTLVQGATNQSHDVVDFRSTEALTTPSGGQARFEAVDGKLRDFSVQMNNPNQGIRTYIWNLDAVAVGTVTFTIETVNGQSQIESFSLDKNGQNFFRFQAVGSEMKKISAQTNVDIKNVKQNRVSPGEPVPEPASMAALGLGVAALLRKRKNRK